MAAQSSNTSSTAAFYVPSPSQIGEAFSLQCTALNSTSLVGSAVGTNEQFAYSCDESAELVTFIWQDIGSYAGADSVLNVGISADAPEVSNFTVNGNPAFYGANSPGFFVLETVSGNYTMSVYFFALSSWLSGMPPADTIETLLSASIGSPVTITPSPAAFYVPSPAQVGDAFALRCTTLGSNSSVGWPVQGANESLEYECDSATEVVTFSWQNMGSNARAVSALDASINTYSPKVSRFTVNGSSAFYASSSSGFVLETVSGNYTMSVYFQALSSWPSGMPPEDTMETLLSSSIGSPVALQGFSAIGTSPASGNGLLSLLSSNAPLTVILSAVGVLGTSVYVRRKVQAASSVLTAPEERERTLSAIMFTDIVGYSTVTHRREDEAMGLVKEQEDIVRPQIEKHGGREVKTIGDSFLAEFPSAVEAVKCALGIQLSVHDLEGSRPEGARMRLRIGIHLGEVLHKEHDVFGDTVNVASRVLSLAPPGGICVTREVFDNVKNKLDLSFESIGSRELKNIPETHEVFRARLPWDK